jgi:hypothetical protein
VLDLRSTEYVSASRTRRHTSSLVSVFSSSPGCAAPAPAPAPAPGPDLGLIPIPIPGPAPDPGSGQGLTLVHFTTQLEPCLTQENTPHTLNTP